MKILQVIDSLWVGGAQKLLVVFAGHALRLGHEIEVVSLIDDSKNGAIFDELESLQIPVNFFPLKNLGDLAAISNISGYMKKSQPDIVHNQLNYANIIGTFTAYLSGIPSVASLHNASSFLFHESRYRTWLETWLLNHFSQRIIACGYAVAKVHQKRFKQKTLEVIPNPMPELEQIDQKSVRQLRCSYLNDEDGILLISVGRLTPEKGYQDMFRAVELVSQKTSRNFKLLIAGSGELHDSLKKEVDEKGLKDHIIFLGQRNDVPILLAASDIFISTSHFEGQSLAVLEALAAGLTVIATDVGDNARVISRDRGFITPSGQPEAVAEIILRLMENPNERGKFADQTAQVVEKPLSSAAWAEKILRVYEEVLNGI